MTATDISELIKRSVDSSEAEEGLYGGSIVLLVALYDDLLEKRKGEISSEPEPGQNFTLNMLESASVMQDSVIGWNEIHDHSVRYRTSSNILTFVDNLGLLYTSEVPCSDKMEVFQTQNIRLIVRTSVAIEETICFSSRDQQSLICFPHSALQFSRLNCTTFVSSFYSERNERSQMFPNYISNETSAEDTSSLHHHLIGLSVDNQTVKLEGLEGLESSLVRLEFHHPGVDLTEAERDCVWWDPAGLAWSRAGCQAVWSTLIGRAMSRLGSHCSRASQVMLAPAILCHKEPARASKAPLLLAGSLWHKGAYNRTFPCMETNFMA